MPVLFIIYFMYTEIDRDMNLDVDTDRNIDIEII